MYRHKNYCSINKSKQCNTPQAPERASVSPTEELSMREAEEGKENVRGERERDIGRERNWEEKDRCTYTQLIHSFP